MPSGVSLDEHETIGDELLETVDAGAVGYASADSFWSNVIEERQT